MSREPSEAAGAFVRGYVSDRSEGDAHVQARARFVEAALESGGRRTADRTRLLLLLGAAVAVVAVSIGGIRLTHAPMTFARGASRAPGVVSEYIICPTAEELPLYFSDGSVVSLWPAARGRVEKTSPNGAAILVESGRLSANIVHRSASDWRFMAGPYSVHVTGTAFVLTWQPSGVLDIEMKSGVVVVQGPGVESGVEVRDRRRFVLSSATHATDPQPTSSTPEGSSGAAIPEPLPLDGTNAPSGAGGVLRGRAPVPHPLREQAPIEDSSPGPDRLPAVESEAARPGLAFPPKPSLPSEVETAAPSWTVLVARGDYSRVLGLAYGRGLDSTLASATVEDLAALADAARFSSQSGVAERTLRELRSRFPASGRAHSSAFLLGRIADDAGDARAAVSWYERYLNEAPGGSLAAEALGRRMLALRRLNDSEGARRAALEYLERFPAGPHANIARDVVGPR